MSSSFLAAASALLIVGGFHSFKEAARARASRVSAGDLGRRRAASTLSRLASRLRIDGVCVISPRGKSARVDHVLLGTRRLVAVETKNWNGRLRGAARDQEWILVRPDGELRRMRNPVSQSRRAARLLREATGAPVEALVLMTGDVSHEDGAMPQGVATPSTLGPLLEALLDGPGREADAQVLSASWIRVSAMAEDPQAELIRARDVEGVERRHSRREWLGWLSVATAAGAAAWTIGGPG